MSLSNHLWYLLMLVGLYLALPVLRMITKDRTVTRYLIWLLVGLASAGIFAFFRGQGGTAREDLPSGLTDVAVRLETCTFGIYLVHFALCDLLTRCLHFDVASWPAAVSVPVKSIVVFLLSLLLTVLLKKIPGIRRVVS